jgi:hypothetical protein
MSQPWSIPNYILIAAVLLGIGLAGYLLYGLYAL